jgi:hypothetical protein
VLPEHDRKCKNPCKNDALDYDNCVQSKELTTPVQTRERKAATDPEMQFTQAISPVSPTIASEVVSIVSNVSPRPPALPHQPLAVADA